MDGNTSCVDEMQLIINQLKLQNNNEQIIAGMERLLTYTNWLSEKYDEHSKKLGKQMQWVSVKDRLPEKDVDVLLRFNYGFYIGRLCKRFWLIDNGSHSRSLDFATHWMPLPPSPEEAD